MYRRRSLYCVALACHPLPDIVGAVSGDAPSFVLTGSFRRRSPIADAYFPFSTNFQPSVIKERLCIKKVAAYKNFLRKISQNKRDYSMQKRSPKTAISHKIPLAAARSRCQRGSVRNQERGANALPHLHPAIFMGTKGLHYCSLCLSCVALACLPVGPVGAVSIGTPLCS